MSWLTAEDMYLFNEGQLTEAYKKLGCHVVKKKSKKGAWFTVWAPNMKSVSVTGDFNSWNSSQHSLDPQGNSGLWSGFVENVQPGQAYKFKMKTHSGSELEKADPFAFSCETAPKTASRVYHSDYGWEDREWMTTRKQRQSMQSAMAIYEMHLGSWKHHKTGGSLSYRELAKELPAYLKKMNFTHVEFMPVMEHPFYGSWGYQTTGYFAPTSRFGEPDDFKYLIDCLHREEIGVILDWVPSHFPADDFALSNFNGGALFEHADPRLGFHPEWKSLIFDYGRREVRSFLISSAMYWLEEFHIDGLRVDAVASMLYLDYSRKAGEWLPNIHGGRENLEAVQFLKELNQAVYKKFPDIHMIAEESTAWPKVSGPVDAGGLGFGMKWDMGWMHDTFKYFGRDPIYRSYHQNDLSFRMMYAFHENFVLSISHDEVVYGKGSVLNKMAGDEWQKFANVRALYAYMYAMPGKKLLFMGSEFAQPTEWNHDISLPWDLLKDPKHQGISNLVQDLNGLYQNLRSLHYGDFSSEGFEWLSADDAKNSVYSFYRKSENGKPVLCIFNLTPHVLENYKVGVYHEGTWKEVLNTDAKEYGGSGVGNFGKISTSQDSSHGKPASLSLTLPPLAALYLQPEDA